jgi:transposase
MDNFHLTAGEIAHLKSLHRTMRDRKVADRVKAIISLGSGWSVAVVAEVLLVDATTVRDWLEKYRRGGEDELLTLKYQGKAPSLTAEQRSQASQHQRCGQY